MQVCKGRVLMQGKKYTVRQHVSRRSIVECRIASSSVEGGLCPGREAGAVVICGLTADRNGLTNVPVLWASQWFADCSDSAGGREMNASRVIKSNAELINAGTWQARYMAQKHHFGARRQCRARHGAATQRRGIRVTGDGPKPTD